MSSIIFDYVTGGVFGFANELRDGVDHLTLASISPIPEAVPRLTADAINQMRSAIEHALFAEVEFQISSRGIRGKVEAETILSVATS